MKKVLINKALNAKEVLVELLGITEYPAVSVIVNKDTASTHDEKLRLKVKNQIKEAVNKLKEEGYDKRDVATLEAKLEKIEDEIFNETGFQSVGIFVSLNRAEYVLLPFEAKDKVVVDDTFEIRDILRTVNQSFQYDVIVLSKKKTKFYNGFQHTLQEVSNSELPEGVEFYLETRIKVKKDDVSKAEVEAIRLYINDVVRFIRVYTDMNTPLIVMGDERLIADFKKKINRVAKVLATIHGSYDDSRVSEISKIINEKLDEYIKIRDKQLLERIQPDIDSLNYVSGIQEVWTVAAMKEARILLVEKGYKVQGYSVDGGLFLLLTDPGDEPADFHEDAIDDLTEMVLLQRGEVYFVTEGLLEKYDRVLETTRF